MDSGVPGARATRETHLLGRRLQRHVFVVRRVSCGLRVRCRSVVFFSFLIYFSAVICLLHVARPYNNNNNIIRCTGTFLLNIVRRDGCDGGGDGGGGGSGGFSIYPALVVPFS